MPSPLSELERQLGESRGQFLRFVRARIADPDLAEDVLQDAMLRAVQAAGALEDEDRLLPWFYAILRNAIVDAYRRRDVRRRRHVPLDAALDPPDPLDETAARQLCECFRALLPTLRPEYAAVLEADLAEETTPQASARLGVTPTNLKVRRHRARAALRERLQQTCNLCAAHGCLDCTCTPA